MNKYQQSDLLSLEYHKLIADKLLANPDLVNKSISNIANWKEHNNFPQPYLDDWLEHINKGVPHLVEFLRSETQEAARLRSSSPFAGVITQDERADILLARQHTITERPG